MRQGAQREVPFRVLAAPAQKVEAARAKERAQEYGLGVVESGCGQSGLDTGAPVPVGEKAARRRERGDRAEDAASRIRPLSCH